MGLINKIDIIGIQKDPDQHLVGALSSVGSILSGNSSIPKTLDRTAIHYDTTESWNSNITTIAQKGHLYIYSDYNTIELENGTIKYFPAVKIGDGSSYLIDMPFAISSVDHEILEQHINNSLLHVSTDDRSDWDSKVSAAVDGETLKFDQRG